MAPGKTTQPIGPRLSTSVAWLAARTAFSAASGSSAPPGDHHLLLGADDEIALRQDVAAGSS